MSVSVSFGAGKETGAILGVRDQGGAQPMAICPNDLITIAGAEAEGNAGGRASCCFDEGGDEERAEFTTESAGLTEGGEENAGRVQRRVPKRDGMGIPPGILQRVRKWRGISGLQFYGFWECARC